MAPHPALLLACAILCLVPAAPRAADTLDVLGVMVEFQQDDPSDLTTGTGKFDSGDNFKLDPKKHDRTYFERHLEFARNFYRTASSQKLFIRFAVVDQTDGRFDHLTLSHPMRHYRVPEKKPEDSTLTYIRQLNQGIMAFAGDALRLLSAKGILDSGFTALGPIDPILLTRDTVRVRPHRTVFLVFHAGASGLIDGGGMGPIFANSQSDLIDSYIWPDDFRDYHGMDYFDGAATVRLDFDRDTARADQRGVYAKDSSNFVQQLLTCSETAGQDGLEFGINGIVVNQIARALGLPDLWDTQKGESAVGGYCLLDVGGYNSVSGFVPVLPSAWNRVFKGWSAVRVAEPDSNFEWTGTLPSFLVGDTVVKVPLSSTEYYLIENRQITPFTDMKFSLTTRAPDTVFNYGTPYDTNYGFWARALLDSLCVDPSKCDALKVNPDRARGVVTASSSYDIGLPGYGALIWHVDESVLRDKFTRNGINDYINRRGVDLEEADGIEDLGAEYVDIFGQRTQAYGGPADFFPHYEAARSKYVNQMTPFNAGTANSNTDRYFSTHTNTGGYTGITVTIDTLPGKTQMTEYMDLVPYEKIRLYAADSFRIKVSWMLSQGRWPQATDTLAPITDPVAVDSTLYGVNDSGLVFIFGARGGLLRTDSTLYRAGYRKLSAPSVRDRSLYFSAGEPGASDSLIVLQYEPESLRITPVKTLHGDTLSTPITVLPGGILIFGTVSGRLYKVAAGMSLAMVLDSTRPVSAVAADTQTVWALSGRTLRKYALSGLTRSGEGNLSGLSGGDARLAVADFYPESPGLEVFCNDHQGNAVLVNAALVPFPGWPVKVAATSPVAPSVGDVDGDGFLDVVIPGDNAIHVLSRNGTALTGWPYTASRREPLGQLTSAVSLSDIDNDNAQELFVPRPDGNLAILDNNGQIYEFTAGARVMGRSLSFGGLPGASCVLANLDTDARGNVPEHLEIYLGNNLGTLSCFNVPMSGSLRSAWSTLGGTLARTFVYEGPAPAARAVAGAFRVDTLFTYPNPARSVNSVTIKYRLAKAAARVTVKLFNSAGDRVLTKTGLPGDFLWNHASLDVAKLAPGLYSLKLEAESGSDKVFKFTKVGVLK